MIQCKISLPGSCGGWWARTVATRARARKKACTRKLQSLGSCYILGKYANMIVCIV